MNLTLINLGGPRTKEEIEEFLTDLFEDPYVFDLPIPEFFRIRLGRFIAKKRAPKVAHSYKSMNYGGGSPLYSETVKLADALSEKLNIKTNSKWNIKIAMTCGPPNIRKLETNDLIPTKDNILLPLFPHFSRSTTMSTAKIIEGKINFCPANSNSLKCNTSCHLEKGIPCGSISKGWIPAFYNIPEYNKTIANLIKEYLTGSLDEKLFIRLEKVQIKDWEKIPILYSAHGIPMRLVDKGDIYPKSIEHNKFLIDEELKKLGYKGQTFLSYQSRVGPEKWTSPNTIDKLRELGNQGFKRIAIYPISFVNDHLETLVEIGEELKEIALQSGIEEYYRIPAPGIYSPFVNFLSNLIIGEYYKS
jgi:protoporphyrin/coproporphyrin ferrochelatase